ncbi:MAG: tol-pal system protein YbgF [Deltaproteobacteria bacterium]|jgi:tol-pal system protein YbgF|nr:tol-pal system protein YbgF [Deltaproteobacteria bacterium]
MRRILSLSLIAATVMVASLAHAKSSDDRIRDLEHQLTNLQRTYMSNNQSTASAIAGAQAVREEWNILKGQVDANRHLIKSENEGLMRVMSGLDHRITAIEDRMAIFSSQLSKALSTVAPQAAEEGDLYQKGLDLVNKSKYLEAASTFQKFIKKYKKSPFAASAMMWVGECYYSMRDNQRAIKEYQKFIERYPRDKNIPTAIFKQGSAFFNLGLIDEATAFYQKVIQSYPSSSAASLAKAKLSSIKERKQKKSASKSNNDLGSYPAETVQQRNQRLRGNTPAPNNKNNKNNNKNNSRRWEGF